MIRLFFLTLVFLSSFNALAASNIVVLGDSLSAAFGLQKKQGWVSLLSKRLESQGYQYTVINASISGETSGGGLRRLTQILDKHKPKVILIELGANDGLRGLNLNRLKKNLSTIVSRSTEKHAQTLLIGVQLPPNYGLSYTQKFSHVFKQVSEENQIPLVPSLFHGFGNDRKYFLADQVHPNASAQPLILENIWPELSKLLR